MDNTNDELDDLLRIMGDENIDLYVYFQLDENATSSEIQQRYVSLMRQYHPDKHTHLSQEALMDINTKVSIINNAKKILLDNRLRNAYNIRFQTTRRHNLLLEEHKRKIAEDCRILEQETAFMEEQKRNAEREQKDKLAALEAKLNQVQKTNDEREEIARLEIQRREREEQERLRLMLIEQERQRLLLEEQLRIQRVEQERIQRVEQERQEELRRQREKEEKARQRKLQEEKQQHWFHPFFSNGSSKSSVASKSSPTSSQFMQNPQDAYLMQNSQGDYLTQNSQGAYPMQNPQYAYPNPQYAYPNPQYAYPNPQYAYPNPQYAYPTQNPQGATYSMQTYSPTSTPSHIPTSSSSFLAQDFVTKNTADPLRDFLDDIGFLNILDMLHQNQITTIKALKHCDAEILKGFWLQTSCCPSDLGSAETIENLSVGTKSST